MAGKGIPPSLPQGQPPPPSEYYPPIIHPTSSSSLLPQPPHPPPTVIIVTPPPFASGCRVLPPRAPAQPGQVIVGWEVDDPEVGCCLCNSLSLTGWLCVIFLFIVFWPLCWLPCVMAECHDRICRPVYGWPAAASPPQQQQQQQQYYHPSAPSVPYP